MWSRDALIDRQLIVIGRFSLKICDWKIGIILPKTLANDRISDGKPLRQTTWPLLIHIMLCIWLHCIAYFSCPSRLTIGYLLHCSLGFPFTALLTERLRKSMLLTEKETNKLDSVVPYFITQSHSIYSRGHTGTWQRSQYFTKQSNSTITTVPITEQKQRTVAHRQSAIGICGKITWSGHLLCELFLWILIYRRALATKPDFKLTHSDTENKMIFTLKEILIIVKFALLGLLYI